MSWPIFNEIVGNQNLYRNKDDSKKFENKKFVFFNEKDFIFCKYICKMYILAKVKMKL